MDESRKSVNDPVVFAELREANEILAKEAQQTLKLISLFLKLTSALAQELPDEVAAAPRVLNTIKEINYFIQEIWV